MAKASKQLAKSKTGRGTTFNSSGSPAPLTEEQIRERAYQLYLERGERPGDPVNDWLRAEREVAVAS